MAKKIKIEKNIPLPVRSSRYPWDFMNCGDSFVVNGKSNARSLAAMATARRKPKKFVARMVNGVHRIWRTA